MVDESKITRAEANLALLLVIAQKARSSEAPGIAQLVEYFEDGNAIEGFLGEEGPERLGEELFLILKAMADEIKKNPELLNIGFVAQRLKLKLPSTSP